MLSWVAGVLQHFADIEEDQFDFHGYCMRKMTLRAYLGYGHGSLAGISLDT
jgi:peptide alpha-N-acetyltransferase